ncbi:MAG: hypothetical protein U0667_12745 [Chloroflexota bacterium]
MTRRWTSASVPALALAVMTLAGCGAARPPGPPASVPPVATPTIDPFAGALPLPAGLVMQGEFLGRPSSHRDMVEGETVKFALGHCGLLSPVDVDGSLWEPVGGADAAGGPIDTEDEVGDLINATPGVVMLVGRDRLDYRSDAAGVWVVFRRLPGPRRYPLCS